MKKNEFLAQLVRYCLETSSEETQVLACMIVLHTHCLKVRHDIVLEDGDGSGIISPLTRRHVSEIVVKALSGLGRKGYDDEHWYYKYDNITPFEVDEDITDYWRVYVESRKSQMKREFVSELWPDY